MVYRYCGCGCKYGCEYGCECSLSECICKPTLRACGACGCDDEDDYDANHSGFQLRPVYSDVFEVSMYKEPPGVCNYLLYNAPHIARQLICSYQNTKY